MPIRGSLRLIAEKFMPEDSTASLYTRLGGYDAIAAVAGNLIGRLVADPLLGRFWKHRSTDGLAREKQLLIDFLCHASGGPLYYTGRDMRLSHAGMGITEEDWLTFMEHVRGTLANFQLPPREAAEVIGFVESTKGEIVDLG